MATGISQARKLLIRALQKYSAADSEAEVKDAMLHLHTGLEKAMRAYLESQGYGEVGHREVSFPELVDLVRDNTNLFRGDPKLPSLLVSLNTTRVKIAHPEEDELSPSKISHDVEKLASLIHGFWPGLFGEACPVSLQVAPHPRPTPRLQEPIFSEMPAEPIPAETTVQRSPPPPESAPFLRRLWKDESHRFQLGLFLKRVIGMAILFTLIKGSVSGALITVRWPEPIKYAGVALLLLAVGLCLWGIVTTWKVLCQLRLKGLVIVLSIGYILLIIASLLISDSPLPLHQKAWLATQQLIVSTGHKVRDVAQALIRIPEEFHFAYTGYRQPVLLPGMDPQDTSYLTPIPANFPAQLPSAAPTAIATRTSDVTQVSTPTPTPTPSPSLAPTTARTASPSPIALPSSLPDCPPQARLTAPRVNEVIRDEIQVKGAANIENFAYYKFEFKREGTEDEWHWIDSFKTPVEEGVLGTWNVSNLPDGIYTLRLTVVNAQGNYPFPPCEVRVQVKH